MDFLETKRSDRNASEYHLHISDSRLNCNSLDYLLQIHECYREPFMLFSTFTKYSLLSVFLFYFSVP